MKKNRLFNRYFFLGLMSIFLLAGMGNKALGQGKASGEDLLAERSDLDNPLTAAVLDSKGNAYFGVNYAPTMSPVAQKPLVDQGLKVGVTLVVTNTNDSGEGSLRWAIQQANATPDLDIIEFNIPGSGPHYIQPLDRLGYINNPVIIDGTTQPGWTAGAPVIVLDGSLTPDGQEGFRLYDNAHGSEIRGLVIGGFDRPIPQGEPQAGYNGFAIVIEVNNTKIQGNFLGIAPDGITPFPNMRGVQIMNSSNNLVGGTSSEERNIISGNISIGATVFGNEVRPGPNSLDNIISGNYFGTDVTGAIAVGNNVNIQVSEGAQNTLIGGTLASQRNIISGATGSSGRGIVIASPGTQNTQIKGNFIGTDATGTAAIPNAYQGINLLQGANQTIIGGTEMGARNIISGNGSYGIGFQFSAASPGTIAVTNNQVIGNYIGLDVNGNPLPNNAGILLSGLSNSNTIGGSDPATRNIISGNSQDGILFWGTTVTNNQVLGNLIGTNPAGTAAIPNSYGIYIFQGANNNIIGGLNPGEGNVISGNLNTGVTSSSHENQILGNLIGTNISGTSAIGNLQRGILISSSENLIQGNLISGNGTTTSHAGIEIAGSNSNVNKIIGNLIGVDVSGQLVLPNSGNGIFIKARLNMIGGLNVGDHNIISGNGSNGILLLALGALADENYIYGNYIGTNPEGLALGNTGNGIDIGGGRANWIGNWSAEGLNTIAFNGSNGVKMSAFNGVESVYNLIASNSIHSNGSHGILLGNFTSIPANDPDDPDMGPNKLQNFPEISNATYSNGQLEISYFVPSSPVNATYPIYLEFFRTNPNERQGRTYIGYDTFTETDFNAGIKTVSLAIPAELGFTIGDQVTATATDSQNNTSPFGILVTTEPGPVNYTITASADNGGSIDPAGAISVAEGDDQLFSITPDTGFEIADVLVDEVSVGAVNEYLFENVNSNHTIVASFQKETFTIAASAGTGGSIGPTGDVVVEFGESQLFSITPDTGYEIADVLVDNVSVGALNEYQFVNVTADHTIVASFQKQTFTIAASAGTGGSIDPTGDVVVEFGESQLFSITADSGYEILDVEVNGQSLGAVSSYLFENVTSNHSIHATFALLPPDLFSLELQVNPVGAGTVSGGGSFEEGQQVQISAFANLGYNFVNWTKGGGEISTAANFSYTMPAEDVILVANFVKQTFTIAASAGTGGSINPAGDVVVEYGESQLFSITADTGYEIADVLVDNVSVGAVNEYLFENVNSNHSIHATFALLPPDLFSLELQVNPVGAGTVSGGGSFEEGQQVQISASANLGYNFVNWTRNGAEISTAADFTYEMPAENVTLVANFVKQTFIITASAGTGGSIDPAGSVVVEYGDSQSFSITADSGYEIADVLVNNVSVGALEEYLFENVTSDQSIHATFELLPPDQFSLTLQVNPANAGIVSGAGSYVAGQQVQVSASPSAGYDFVNWTRNGEEISTSADFTYEMPAENVTLVANFVKQTFIITASAGTGGSIDPAGSVVVEYGDSQSFSITADSGYEIADVLVNSQSVGAVSSYLFENVTSNQSIHTSFELIPADLYSLSLQVNPIGAGTVSGGGSYEEGQQVQISASANLGYDFANWTKGGVEVSTASDFTYEMPAENVTLVANFVKQTFIITASAGPDGSISPVGSVLVEYGDSQSFSITADLGYEIADVMVNNVSVGALEEYLFENVTSDQSIHATFRMLQTDLFSLSLVAMPEDGGTVYGAGDYEAGTLVNVSAMAYAGYRFIYWTMDGQVISGQSSFVFTMPEQDVVLTAHFEEGMGIYCSFSQGYWFAKPDVEWPYDVIVGGHTFTQEQGQQFWPSNNPTKRAFTQFATIYLSGVTLSEFPELAAAMEIIDQYFASVYPQPANGEVNRAAGLIGNWIDENHCVETFQGIAQFNTTENKEEDWFLDGAIHLKAYPNPFRNQATIEFQAAENTRVTLELFNLAGERISVLFDSPVEAFERHTVILTAREMPVGIYFYRLTAGQHVHTGRLILAK